MRRRGDRPGTPTDLGRGVRLGLGVVQLRRVLLFGAVRAVREDRAVQASGEDADPREDQREGDDLEAGEVEKADHEHRDRSGETESDRPRGDDETLRDVAAADHGDDEDREEREHETRRGAIVQPRVGVHRDHADRGEVDADRHLEQDEDAGPLRHALVRGQRLQIQPHSDGEDDDEHARRDQRAVEHVAGEARDGPQFAEVQLPPAGGGGREDRHQHAGTEQRHHEDGQPPGRELQQRSRRSAREAGEEARRVREERQRCHGGQPGCRGVY